MRPGFSTQSSFSYAPTVSQGPFASQPLYRHVDDGFTDMGDGFEHGMRQVGATLTSDEDDEEFSRLFNQHGKPPFQN